jgi:WD40 repeat protein
VLCVKVSSCLRYVLSGSTDTHIRLWSLDSGEWIHTYEVHTYRFC